MSEDCLTLNIVTNNIGLFQKKPQAVMVWIHGGGFMFGSKDQYRMQVKIFYEGWIFSILTPKFLSYKFIHSHDIFCVTGYCGRRCSFSFNEL